MATAFRWEPGEPPPRIEEHSLAKLEVLRSYLHNYYNTLNQNVRREEFRLDLVDGFAGGGLYSHHDEVISGSPLVMLEELQSAERRLNEGRSKPLRFDVKHHFVEKDPKHAEYLWQVLDDRDHLREKGRVVLHRRGFDEVLDQIISDIRPSQRRRGRSIFLLDQCGYTDADIRMVRRIGERLPQAEVILTISIDTMLNFSTPKELVARLASLGVPKDYRVEAALHGFSTSHRKALMQRVLPEMIVKSTAFRWFTPFFIRPEKSRWDLWFIHFSRNATARDVMLNCHWKIRNAFAHYGESFGPKMLGYDALASGQVPILTFNDNDREEMNTQIRDQLMSTLHGRLVQGPMDFREMPNLFGNSTAATYSDFNDIVLAWCGQRELEIVGPDGRVRRQSLEIIKPNDKIALPSQRTLSLGSNRVGQSKP